MGYLSQLAKQFRTDTDSKMTDLSRLTSGEMQVDTVIGLPSWQGGLEPDTQTCLDKLVHRNIVIGNNVRLIKSTGSLIAHNRNEIVKASLEVGAKYVLFIDTDMIFAEDALQRMQAHMMRVMSALAFVKSPPYLPNMYNRIRPNGWAPLKEWKDGEVVRVDCVGGAFLLVETDVFRRIKPPWFAQPPMIQHLLWENMERIWNTKDDRKEICEDILSIYRNYQNDDGVIGEDYYFSELLRRAGIPLYVDTGMQIGHIGKYPFSYHDFAAQVKSGALDKFMDLDKVGEDADK